MNTKSTQLTTSHDVLGNKINAFIEFLANSETRDKSDQVTQLKRIFEIGNDLPTSFQQRNAILEHATEKPLNKKGQTL